MLMDVAFLFSLGIHTKNIFRLFFLTVVLPVYVMGWRALFKSKAFIGDIVIS